MRLRYAAAFSVLFLSTASPFTLASTVSPSVTKGSWAGIWSNAGMNLNASAKNAAVVLTLTITLNGQDYQIPATVMFSANKGRGTFKHQ